MKKRILSVIIAGAMLFASAASAQTVSPGYNEFERMSSYGANLYIDEGITTEQIMTEALKKVINEHPELKTELIKAGFQSLDEYSEFYTKEEYELFKKNIDHIAYGIGVLIQQQNGYVTVLSLVDGGGAKDAGVLPGDKISKVNGVSVKGESLEKVQDLIIGEVGTQVNVTFLRGDNEFECTITRKEIRGTTVAGEILKSQIGYIIISNFAQNTAKEFSDVLADFDKAGVSKIILDLRDNPGGYLDSAIEIARMTVPEGVIVKRVDRDERQSEAITSTLKTPRYRFCILINGNTASASEVLASAMSDSGVGYLVGEKSYGKGVIQTMYEMLDGSGFKITTGKYFTRNGNDINKHGIEPDEYIENSTRPIDISKYSTFDYKTKPTVGDVSQNVRAAKERLSIMGYYYGTVDDVFEPALADAICKFQKDSELGVYGVLDISTQVKMENTFYKIEVLEDDQLYYAYEYFGGNVEDLKK